MLRQFRKTAVRIVSMLQTLKLLQIQQHLYNEGEAKEEKIDRKGGREKDKQRGERERKREREKERERQEIEILEQSEEKSSACVQKCSN